MIRPNPKTKWTRAERRDVIDWLLQEFGQRSLEKRILVESLSSANLEQIRSYIFDQTYNLDRPTPSTQWTEAERNDVIAWLKQEFGWRSAEKRILVETFSSDCLENNRTGIFDPAYNLARPKPSAHWTAAERRDVIVWLSQQFGWRSKEKRKLVEILSSAFLEQIRSSILDPA